MPGISYANLHSDSSLQQALWTPDGTTESSKEQNLCMGDTNGGVLYVLGTCFFIRLHSTTWGLTARSTTSCTPAYYNPSTGLWVTLPDWSTGQASGFSGQSDSTKGHNCTTLFGSGTERYHLWKFTFHWSYSGSNRGSYNYCCFYPSYAMSQSYWDAGIKKGYTGEIKPIVGILPRIMYINSSYSSITAIDGQMWRYYVPSESYIINRFVDKNLKCFKDPALTGKHVTGVGTVTSYRPSAKDICWTA